MFLHNQIMLFQNLFQLLDAFLLLTNIVFFVLEIASIFLVFLVHLLK